MYKLAVHQYLRSIADMFEPSEISTSGEHRDLPVEPTGIIPELAADVAVEDWELLEHSRRAGWGARVRS